MKFHLHQTVAYSSLVKSDDISVESNAKSKLPTVCLPKFRYRRKREKYLNKYTTAQLVSNFNRPHNLSTFVAFHYSAKIHSFHEWIHKTFF